MRTALRWTIGSALVLTLLVVLFVAHSLWFKPLHIRIFFERVFAEYLFENPEMLSSMRILPAWLDWYSDDLADASLAFEDRMREKLANDLATLRRYEHGALDAETRVSYDMLEYVLAFQREGDRRPTREDRHARDQRGNGDRALPRQSRPGVGLQGRHERDPRAARARPMARASATRRRPSMTSSSPAATCR